MSEYEIYRLGIGRKFQTPTVYVDHTVFENLLLSLEGSRGVWASLFSRVTPAQKDRIHDVLGDDQACRESATGRPARLRTGKSNGWRSACCSRRTRSLLLVDEPAAGMTDEETARTGELLLSAGRQAQHRRDRTRHGFCPANRTRTPRDRAAPGHRALRGSGGRGAEQRKSHRGLPRPEQSALIHARSQKFTGRHRREPHSARRQPHRAGEKCHVPHGSKRCRQDHDLEDHHRLAEGRRRHGDSRRRTAYRPFTRSTRTMRHRLRAAGTRDFPAPHRGRKPEDRRGGAGQESERQRRANF